MQAGMPAFQFGEKLFFAGRDACAPVWEELFLQAGMPALQFGRCFLGRQDACAPVWGGVFLCRQDACAPAEIVIFRGVSYKIF